MNVHSLPRGFHHIHQDLLYMGIGLQKMIAQNKSIFFGGREIAFGQGEDDVLGGVGGHYEAVITLGEGGSKVALQQHLNGVVDDRVARSILDYFN